MLQSTPRVAPRNVACCATMAHVAQLNWTYWKYNDAAEIAKMLDI
jgi:hypothetical protein